MTASGFRRIALGFEGAIESAHMGHPDFRAGGRIFATLQHPDKRWGMVKLPPADQDRFVRDHPGVFVPCNGAWGRGGCTNVLLKAVKADVLRAALDSAWGRAVNPPRPVRPPHKSTRSKRAR
jgi:hypothetical protein